MELYNFFTENIGADRLGDLEEAKKEIDELFGENACLIVKSERSGQVTYALIGQVWGADTNAGDTELLWIFHHSGEIKYTWFDSTCPKINNIDQNI